VDVSWELESAVELFGADRRVALVLAVARLGETNLRTWWRCHGLDQAGEWVLKGTFPRSWRWVALELDVISAARRHQEVLPRSTALHLFSDGLPFRRLAAAWLAERKTASDSDPLFDAITGWDTEAAAMALTQWAGQGDSPDAKRVGPASCLGSLAAAALEHDSALSSVCDRLAAAYGTMGTELIPPYFDLVP
jgi:hypothetical protein